MLQYFRILFWACRDMQCDFLHTIVFDSVVRSTPRSQTAHFGVRSENFAAHRLLLKGQSDKIHLLVNTWTTWGLTAGRYVPEDREGKVILSPPISIAPIAAQGRKRGGTTMRAKNIGRSGLATKVYWLWHVAIHMSDMSSVQISYTVYAILCTLVIYIKFAQITVRTVIRH